MRSYRVLGVPIADGTVGEALAEMEALVHGDGPRSLFFVNAHTLNNAAEDGGYRDVLARATRVYGDGTGVRWAARCRGLRLQGNLNGTDLVPALLARGSDIRCFILGSAPERTEAILAEARRRFPNSRFVGAHHGYLDEAAGAEIVARIAASGANLVLVGMGNPLQERWIDRHRDALPGALLVAVGGLLEYWSGHLDRAPSWMRRTGVEWVHLMLRQPWKARRYLVGNPLYLVRMLRSLPADRMAVPHG